MRKSLAVRVAICGVFCLGVLVTMFVQHAWPLWTGKTIYLEVRPVDPRDLFRGEYVILSYDITRLAVGRRASGDDSIIPPDGAWWDALERNPLTARPAELYVHLRRAARAGAPAGPQTYMPVRVSSRPSADTLSLRGRVIDFRPGPSDSYTFRMEYGIEAFYVQEGTGRPIQQALFAGQPVFAEIAVTPSGRARVRDVIVGP